MVLIEAATYLNVILQWTIRGPLLIVSWGMYFIYAGFAFIFSSVWGTYNALRGTFQYSIDSIFKKTFFKFGDWFKQNYERHINQNPVFESGSYFALKLLLKWFLYNPIKWIITIADVIRKSAIPVLFYLAVCATFGVLLYPLILLEGNLVLATRLTDVIVAGFLDLLNFLAGLLNVIIDFANPLLPYAYLILYFLIRLFSLIFKEANDSLGRTNPFYHADRSLNEAIKLQDGDYNIYNRRSLQQDFFSSSEQAGWDVTVVSNVFSEIMQWNFRVVFFLFQAQLIIIEIFYRIFLNILNQVVDTLSGAVVFTACCEVNPGCCFLEIIANLLILGLFFGGGKTIILRILKVISTRLPFLGFLLNFLRPLFLAIGKLFAIIGSFLKCPEGAFPQDQCQCSQKENGIFQNGPACFPPAYTCIQDSDGYWTQYEQVTEDTQPIPQITNLDKELACPQLYPNLAGSARTLMESRQLLPYQPSRCSKYCYPNKFHTGSMGWEIERCEEDEYPIYHGPCKIDEENKNYRLLYISETYSQQKYRLKEFHKQYKPNRKVKPLSVRERKERLREHLMEHKMKKKVDRALLKQDFIEFIDEMKKQNSYKFPSSYDADSPTLLESLIYDQIEMFSMMFGSVEKDLGKTHERMLDEEEDLPLDLYPIYENVISTSYLKPIVHIAKSLQWKSKNNNPITLDDMDNYHKLMMESHKAIIKTHFDDESFIPDFSATSRNLLNTINDSVQHVRRRHLTDNTYTENQDTKTDLGVFGETCDYLCPDARTCVPKTREGLLSCPEADTLWKRIFLYPAYFLSTWEANIDVRYLIDQAIACWNIYETNPSVNPLSLDEGPSGISNFILAFYTPNPEQFQGNKKRQFDNFIWCFPLTSRIGKIPKIIWSFEQYMIEQCSNDDGTRCTCTMFAEPADLIDYQTMILSFMPEATYSRIYNTYVYLNMGLGYMAQGWFTPLWEGFWGFFNLNLFDNAEWFYFLFNFEYATKGQSTQAIQLCSFLNIFSLIWTLLVILYPLLVLIYNGAYDAIKMIAKDLLEIVLFIPMNTLTLVDAIYAQVYGIDPETLEQLRVENGRENFDILSQNLRNRGITFVNLNEIVLTSLAGPNRILTNALNKTKNKINLIRRQWNKTRTD